MKLCELDLSDAGQGYSGDGNGNWGFHKRGGGISLEAQQLFRKSAPWS